MEENTELELEPNSVMDSNAKDEKRVDRRKRVILRSLGQHVKNFIVNITVEPILFLVMLCALMSNVISTNLLLYKSCKHDYNFTETVCSHLTAEENSEANVAVQKTVATFMLYMSLVETFVPICCSLFLGAWSDIHGRKGIMIFVLTGLTFQYVSYLLNAYYIDWPKEYYLFTVNLAHMLSGGQVSLMMSTFSYISDITTTANRTLRMALMELAWLLGTLIGLPLGAYFYAKWGYLSVFGTTASLIFIALMYVIIRLRNVKGKQQIQDTGSSNTCRYMLGQVKDAFLTTFKKRDKKRRLYLLLLLLTMLLFSIPVRGEHKIQYLFVRQMFLWNARSYTTWGTYHLIVVTLSTAIAMPLFHKFGVKDTIIGMAGTITTAVASIIFAFADSPTTFYIGALFHMITMGSVIVIRSMMSKCVPKCEFGKVSAVLASAEAIEPLLSSAIYTQMYNSSTDSVPGAVFFFSAAICLVATSIFLFIHISLRGQTLESQEHGKEKELEIKSVVENGIEVTVL